MVVWVRWERRMCGVSLSHPLFFFSLQTNKRAGLPNVTDSGVSVLASAGCGAKHMSLTLNGDWVFLFHFNMGGWCCAVLFLPQFPE